MTRTGRLALLAALGLIALFLVPLLGTTFLEDDTYNNYIDGWMGWEHLSFAHGLALMFAATNLGNGRFYPVYPLLLVGEFHLVHSAPVMKALVIAAVVLNAFTFWLLVRRFAPALATPALVLLPATLQIRFYHDPLAGFSLHMQLALEFALLGFLGLAAFGASGRRRALVLGAAAYGLACLTYEATYAYVLAFAALGRQLVRDARTRLGATALFVAIPLVCAAIALGIRARVPLEAASDYRVHWDASAIAGTFLREVAGGVPLLYAALDPGGFLPPLPALLGTPGWSAVALGVLAALLGFAALGKPEPAPGLRFALLFGALLAILPAALIVLSARQQREIVWGLAYTPAYLQYFGVALLLGAGADALARRGQTPRALTALALGWLVAGTFSANRLTLAHYASYWGTTVLPSALDAGLLANARDGSRLYLDDSYPVNRMFDDGNWNAKYFYYYHTGKRLELHPLAHLERPETNPAFAVLGRFAGGARGEAAAGAVVRVARAASGTPVPFVETALVYSRESAAPELRAFRSGCGVVTLESLLSGTPSGVILTYGDGFFPEERDAAARWRWSSRPAQLRLENPAEGARTVRLSFVLRPARTGSARASIGWPGGVQALELRGADATLERSLVLGPHAAVEVPLDVAGEAYRPAHDPRLLLFQLRALELREPACGALERDAATSNRRTIP